MHYVIYNISLLWIYYKMAQNHISYKSDFSAKNKYKNCYWEFSDWKNTGYSGTKLHILVMNKNKNIFAGVETVLSHGETSIVKFSIFCSLRHSEPAFTWHVVGNLWFQYYYKMATSQN